MERDRLNHQDVIDYIRAEEVKLELGLISLTSVSRAEQHLMIREVQENRLLEMTTAIGVSYLNQENTLSVAERQGYNMLARIEALETGQPLEVKPDNSHLISIWDLEAYLNTLNLPSGEANKFKGAIVRSGTPPTLIMNLSVINRQYIEGLIVFRDKEMPVDLPVNKRRFVNMLVLETAYRSGEFRKIFGISRKRIIIAENLINHWRATNSHSAKPEQLDS
jgi:hypothetical protein